MRTSMMMRSPLLNGSPCIVGEFEALDALFETLDETEAWYVLLPNHCPDWYFELMVRSDALR
jgi:hypothetical protein